MISYIQVEFYTFWVFSSSNQEGDIVYQVPKSPGDWQLVYLNNFYKLVIAHPNLPGAIGSEPISCSGDAPPLSMA